MLLDFIKIILNDLKKRKFSSFLTFFGISLGIMTIFLIFLVSTGFEKSIEKQFEQMGSNRLYITSSTQSLTSSSITKGLSDREMELVLSRSYVDKVYPYYMRGAQVKFGNNFYSKQLMGTKLSEDYFSSYGFKIEFGRAPKENEKYSIVLGSLATSTLFDKPVSVGSNIYIKDLKFKVVGILESVGNDQDDAAIYVPIDTIREIYDAGDNIGFMDVLIVNGVNPQIAASNLKILLENRLGKDTINIVEPKQLLEQVGSILDIIKYTLGGIAFVALFVGAIGIINTMYVIVTEKTKEIGIMKSVGATNSNVLSLFVLQAGIFGVLGSIIGIILGSILAKVFESIAKASGFGFLEIEIIPIYILYLLMFGFFIGIFSGFLPAYRASRINIVEAIRK